MDHDITPESGYYLSLDKVGADCIDNIKLPTQNNLVSTTTMREGLRTHTDAVFPILRPRTMFKVPPCDKS